MADGIRVVLDSCLQRLRMAKAFADFFAKVLEHGITASGYRE
jgi:hypothetical protein